MRHRLVFCTNNLDCLGSRTSIEKMEPSSPEVKEEVDKPSLFKVKTLTSGEKTMGIFK